MNLYECVLMARGALPIRIASHKHNKTSTPLTRDLGGWCFEEVRPRPSTDPEVNLLVLIVKRVRSLKNLLKRKIVWFQKVGTKARLRLNKAKGSRVLPDGTLIIEKPNFSVKV